jgi:hypothetical protein
MSFGGGFGPPTSYSGMTARPATSTAEGQALLDSDGFRQRFGYGHDDRIHIVSRDVNPIADWAYNLVN